jgi:hypothetical protein
MFQSVRRTLHPSWYQGHGKKPPYFEGWYYKLVDPLERHRLAVIPGVFKGTDPEKSHAFVQVLDGVSGETTYQEYPVGAFRAARQGLDIEIGPNRFTVTDISLAIESPARSVKGALSFTGVSPWPSTVISPGIMGAFGWLPFLQTYHGVVSLDHVIHGALTVDDDEILFGGGRGYTEKDWGQSFPEAWIWTQTNHFDQVGTSFTASIATIPLLGFSFRGLIVGLWHETKLYRFATYTGARIEELTIGDDHVHILIRDRDHGLEVTACRAKGGILRGPTGFDMGGRVPESLRAVVRLRLSALTGDEPYLIFEGTGRNAGLEVVGDLDKLVG